MNKEISDIQNLATSSANREIMINWKGRVEVPKTETNDAQTLVENAPSWKNK